MSGFRMSQRIVDAATALIRVRGYNAFSYQDISELVGIRKASVHHHFPTKADLGRAVVQGATRSFGEVLQEIEAAWPTGLSRIAAYAELSGGLVEQDELCPCAMLASEAETIPPAVNEELRAYYTMLAGWIERRVREGREDGSVRLAGEAEDIALMILGTVQGAAVTARCMKSRAAYDAALGQLRRLLGGAD